MIVNVYSVFIHSFVLAAIDASVQSSVHLRNIWSFRCFCLFIWFCLCVCLYVCLSPSPSPSLSLSVCLCMYVSLLLPLPLSLCVYPAAIHQSVYLLIYLSVCMSVCPCVFLFVFSLSLSLYLLYSYFSVFQLLYSKWHAYDVDKPDTACLSTFNVPKYSAVKNLNPNLKFVL